MINEFYDNKKLYYIKLCYNLIKLKYYKKI